MPSLDRKLFRDMRRLWGPALAIAVVMACGVATAVLMFGTRRSLDETREAYYERYRFADVFASLKRAPEYLMHDAAEIPGVAMAQSRIVVDVVIDVAGMPEPARGRIISIPESGPPVLNGVAMNRGRWIRDGHGDEIIVSENFAEAHGFDPGDELSAIINGRKRTLRIVGIGLSPEYIYAVSPGQLMPDDRTFGVVWMGRKALEAAYDLKGAFNDVSLTLLRNASAADVIDRLDQLLDPYGGVGAYERADQFSDVFITNELKQLDMFGRVIPPLFLGVAAFLLNIVVNRMVQQEREEIGLLKAFGYTNGEVGLHYAKFVLMLSSAGILLGLLFGLWLGRAMTELYAQFFRFPFLYYRVDTGVFASASLLSLAAASAGAFNSIRKVVKLEPAVAMRPAAPTVYRPTLIERIGWSERVSEGTRMIWRHIERWPIRSGLTTLGIALSVALLIGTLFPLEGIEHVIDVHYFHSQRQDATITFVEPRNAFTSSQVKHLPGVMRVEPFRAVPSKVSFGHREERISLIGINPDAEINRMIDVGLRPIAVPPNGIVLSTYLSQLIGAEAGDTVRVEVTMGRRPKADIEVVSIVEEFIGFSAYMDLGALNRLMRDDAVVSGFHVSLDDSERERLFKKLKDTPTVAGISLKSTVLNSFRDTIAKTMNIALSVYFFFAGAIAFGVVYNSARIAFAERQRELASLCVLGFTKGEVSFIMLGELIVLTLLALPLGCVLGYLMALLMVQNFDTDLIRLPLYLTSSTYATGMLVVLIAAVVSSFAVARKINQLDLVSALKIKD